jgi:hypothetical protein
MDHVRKCTDALRPVIAAGDINGLPLAETALSEMLDRTAADDHKSSLESVRLAVQEHSKAAGFGFELPLADAINNYIEKLMRNLE